MSESRNLFTPYPCSGQDKCRRCFNSRLIPFKPLGSRVCGVSKSLQCFAWEVLSRFRAQVGTPVVPLASPILGIIWVIRCHPSFCRCLHDLRRKHYPLIRFSLSFLLLTLTV